jgi:hypothetical protein
MPPITMEEMRRVISRRQRREQPNHLPAEYVPLPPGFAPIYPLDYQNPNIIIARPNPVAPPPAQPPRPGDVVNKHLPIFQVL